MDEFCSRSLTFTLAAIYRRGLSQGGTGSRFLRQPAADSESIRLRIATRFKTGGAEAFDLLQAIGRDCVGAEQLLGLDWMKNRTTFNASRARLCLNTKLTLLYVVMSI